MGSRCSAASEADSGLFLITSLIGKHRLGGLGREEEIRASREPPVGRGLSVAALGPFLIKMLIRNHRIGGPGRGEEIQAPGASRGLQEPPWPIRVRF